jgi:NADPH-dependent curcumin reductase CurA
MRAAPNFGNVGGEHLEAALTAANRFARFALCGMISQYNVARMPAGPRNIMFAVGKSIRLEGFIVYAPSWSAPALFWTATATSWWPALQDRNSSCI